jgi:flagellar biosynthesis GTPase FlhF
VSALETRTFRADDLEAVLGVVREELGPDAIVVRQREGIIGGIGGFFGKRCVEVDVECPPAATAPAKPSAMPARAITNAYASTAAPADPFLLDDLSFDQPSFDRASLDDALFDEASFADDGGDLFKSLIGDNSVFGATLADAFDRDEPEVAPFEAAFESQAHEQTITEPVLVEPQPTGVEYVEIAHAPIEQPALVQPEGPGPIVELEVSSSVEIAPLTTVASVRLALMSAGLDIKLADSIVNEADQQLRIFDPHEPFENQAREVIAGRISTKRLNGRFRRRVIVVAGIPGSGKTSAAARLCEAHVVAGKKVLAVSLASVRATLELGRQTEGLDVELVSADHIGLVEFALARMQQAEIVIVDTPGVEVADASGWTNLAMLLRPIAANETHLLVPGSLDAAGVDAYVGAASQKLGIDRLILSHPGSRGPGTAVAASVRAGIPISGTATASRLVPADAYKLAAAILP